MRLAPQEIEQLKKQLLDENWDIPALIEFHQNKRQNFIYLNLRLENLRQAGIKTRETTLRCHQPEHLERDIARLEAHIADLKLILAQVEPLEQAS